MLIAIGYVLLLAHLKEQLGQVRSEDSLVPDFYTSVYFCSFCSSLSLFVCVCDAVCVCVCVCDAVCTYVITLKERLSNFKFDSTSYEERSELQ